jgi:PPOX class probable F420-dependent enzyme
VLIEDAEQNARAERRLREDLVVWLTTVRRDGQPQSTPVWFVWDGDREVLIYSIPNQQKLRNIRANPKVSLHFNDHDGDDVVALEAEARIDESAPRNDEVQTYLEKYRQPIANIGYDVPRFAEAYSTAIRATITRARAPF